MKLYNSRDEYYDDHEVCPKCGNGTSQTYEGFMFYKGRPFKDENWCECDCGWEGIVNELVNKKNKNASLKRR